MTKMSRIIAHVGIGEKGKYVVQQLQARLLSCCSSLMQLLSSRCFEVADMAPCE